VLHPLQLGRRRRAPERGDGEQRDERGGHGSAAPRRHGWMAGGEDGSSGVVVWQESGKVTDPTGRYIMWQQSTRTKGVSRGKPGRVTTAYTMYHILYIL
jgi:hypothetical protein